MGGLLGYAFCGVIDYHACFLSHVGWIVVVYFATSFGSMLRK